MNQKETCERIVANGGCYGIHCGDCPFATGATNDHICKEFLCNISAVNNAKKWLEENMNEMPKLKSGYVVKGGKSWWNIIDNDGDITAFNASGSRYIGGIGEITEVRQYQKELFSRNADNQAHTNPIWKKDKLVEVPVSELIALYEKENGVKIKIGK